MSRFASLWHMKQAAAELSKQQAAERMEKEERKLLDGNSEGSPEGSGPDREEETFSFSSLQFGGGDTDESPGESSGREGDSPPEPSTAES